MLRRINIILATFCKYIYIKGKDMRKKLLLITLLTASTILVAGNYSRSNNMVTDHDTGLQWTDTPYTAAEKAVYNSRTEESGRTLKWINSKAYCTNLGDGWRLASINELLTIVDTSYYNPAMDPIFESALPLGFWSATLSTTVGGSAQGIGFLSGSVHNCGIDGAAKFVRCVRTGTTTPPPPPPPPTGDNIPPTADAGPDKTVQVNNPVTISGSGNDTDGDIVSYSWTRNGSFYTNEQIFEFTPSGTLPKTFVLTVTDDEGAKGTDEMVLTVTNDATPPPPTDNVPPTADAGPDKTVQVNNPVTISGSGNDTDGDIVSYSWTRNGSFYTNEQIFEFTPSGTLPKTFVLTVTDDEGAKGTDEMVLTVTNDATPPPPTDNVPPTADAGPDKTVQVNNPVTISGSGSSDSDGSIVAFEWMKQSTGQILSRSETFVFTPTGKLTKTLVLTVTDDKGATASDEMILTVTN